MTENNDAGDEPTFSANPQKPSADETAADAAEAKKQTPRKQRILIGSQRDSASVKLKTREPQAVRFASISPENISQAIRAKSTTHDVADQPPAAAAEPDSPPVDTSDQELEMALQDLSMDSLLATSQPADELDVDSRLKATVSKIHNDNVFFSLKGRFEGVASLRQFKTPPAEGAMLDVIVTGYNQDDGLYEVAIPGSAVSVADWSDLTDGAVVEARITGSNTGGLECMINNIRGFIPASQIDLVRVENFGEYVNQKMTCVVTEVNPRRKKLVLSHRAILERQKQEQKEQLLQSLEPGQTVEGTVTKLMDFGAFVDIGGVEGLVHVSKMSWDRVDHPSDVFEAGQRVSVKIEKISPGSGKISLSYRDTQENPWTRIEEKYPVGAQVSGEVSRLAQFGAFVKLEPGVEGLIHISELAHHRVIAVKNVVQTGDLVDVKVLAVDPEGQKIGLSLKATQPKPEKRPDSKATDETPEHSRPSAVKKRTDPLKGGRDKPSGGDQFGLNW